MKAEISLESYFEIDLEFLMPGTRWQIDNKADLGNLAEQYVLEFLLSREFRKVAVNYRERPYGEVDLIVKNDQTHYFIEVKARRNSGEEMLESIVTPRQYARLLNAAELYSARNNVSVRICLALLSIQDEAQGSRLSLRFLPLA